MSVEKVRWMDWGKKAFERARKENKPILLDIFGVWCHWCHRMDQDNYENPEIAKVINESFVPVRVDTDKRPDVNERYNVGGWPSTVFLDEEGNVITAATYVPPQNMGRLLQQVLAAFPQSAAPIKVKELELRKGQLSPKIAEEVSEMLANYFDHEYGGFGYDQKFPNPEILQFFLHRFRKTKDKDLLVVAKKTLAGMQSGLLDREAGGFFRYSTTRDWQNPHYEKMLDVNSGLIKAFALCSELSGQKEFLETARLTLNYVLTTLSSPKGGFYASQDADGELDYYGLSKEERRKKPEPYIDKTIYADLNGEAAAWILGYYRVTKDKNALEFALKTLDLLLRRYSTKDGFAHYFDKRPVVLGLLRDNVNPAFALLKAYENTNQKKYLSKSEEAAGLMIQRFWDSRGGFYDKAESKDDFGLLKVRRKRIELNSRAARFFIGLYKATKNKRYLEIAREALEIFATNYLSYNIMAVEYALAVDEFLDAKP